MMQGAVMPDPEFLKGLRVDDTYLQIPHHRDAPEYDFIPPELPF